MGERRGKEREGGREGRREARREARRKEETLFATLCVEFTLAAVSHAGMSRYI